MSPLFSKQKGFYLFMYHIQSDSEVLTNHDYFVNGQQFPNVDKT